MTIVYPHLKSALMATLLAASMSVPVLAAEHSDNADDTTMPASPSQAEHLEDIDDDAAGTQTREKGLEVGGAPATQAQKEHLEETDNMSTDKAINAEAMGKESEQGSAGSSGDSAGTGNKPTTHSSKHELTDEDGMSQDSASGDQPTTHSPKHELTDKEQMSQDGNSAQ